MLHHGTSPPPSPPRRWQDGLRSGRGAYKWAADGRILRGVWRKGAANGAGLLTRRNPSSDEEAAAAALAHPAAASPRSPKFEVRQSNYSHTERKPPCPLPSKK